MGRRATTMAVSLAVAAACSAAELRVPDDAGATDAADAIDGSASDAIAEAALPSCRAPVHDTMQFDDSTFVSRCVIDGGADR